MLAKDEFAIDGGLSPSEVKQILERRFSIGQNSRKLEQAMAAAPTNFFVVGPAPFHGKMKLYRPMLACFDRVKQLLSGQAAQPISATAGSAQQEPVVA